MNKIQIQNQKILKLESKISGLKREKGELVQKNEALQKIVDGLGVGGGVKNKSIYCRSSWTYGGIVLFSTLMIWVVILVDLYLRYGWLIVVGREILENLEYVGEERIGDGVVSGGRSDDAGYRCYMGCGGESGCILGCREILRRHFEMEHKTRDLGDFRPLYFLETGIEK